MNFPLLFINHKSKGKSHCLCVGVLVQVGCDHRACLMELLGDHSMTPGSPKASNLRNRNYYIPPLLWTSNNPHEEYYPDDLGPRHLSCLYQSEQNPISCTRVIVCLLSATRSNGRTLGRKVSIIASCRGPPGPPHSVHTSQLQAASFWRVLLPRETSTSCAPWGGGSIVFPVQ